MQPTERETAELKDRVITMGFGRVGQTIAQLLSERLADCKSSANSTPTPHLGSVGVLQSDAMVENA